MKDDLPAISPHPSDLQRSIVKEIGCVLLVTAIGIGALRSYLFTRQALYWGDIELYFAPMQSFFSGSLRHGVIPLWNPDILCGEPFVGNPQTWPLYPSTLLAGQLPAWQFLTLINAAHLLLGGALFYGFLRGERLSRRAGSILGAVCFMLGGYFVTKTQFPNMAQAIAWVPAVLWCAGRLARKPGFWSALWLGSALGLQLLAAHAQITLLTGYLALAYALFVAWPRLASKADGTAISSIAGTWGRLAGWGIAALLLACCLDAGELLPVLEVWKHSDRQTLTLATANRFVLRPSHLVGLIAPNAFGSPFDGNFRGGGNYWEPACYLGVVPCLLALWEIIRGWRRQFGETLFWSGALIVSLWLALGRGGGLYILAFHFAPGLKAFHDPARMLLGAAVAGAALAGRGLDTLLIGLAAKAGQTARFGIALGLIALTAVDLAHFDRRAYPLMSVKKIDAAVAQEQAESGGLAESGRRVVYPPDNKATWRYFADYQNYRRGDPNYLPSLLATRTTNTGMLLGIRDAGGYEPEPPLGAVRRYIDAYNDHEQGRGDAGLDALDAGALISFQTGAAPGASQGYFQTHRMSVWRNPARLVTPARLGKQRYLPFQNRTADLATVQLPSGPSGELHIADTDAPGWTATLSVAGQKIALPVLRSPNGLQEVALPARATPGELTLAFRPSAWRIGLFLTLLAAGFVAGCAAFAVLSQTRAAKAS